jgi:hypothetical protein
MQKVNLRTINQISNIIKLIIYQNLESRRDRFPSKTKIPILFFPAGVVVVLRLTYIIKLFISVI